VSSFKFSNGIADQSGSAAAVMTPIACPACQSPVITTTARNPDDNTYWRCGSCGEIWNASRREAGPSRRQPRR
jgi:hypothetical protein